jgi:7-cyano-7-deazaguanine tRNA-ribosyltransferase
VRVVAGLSLKNLEPRVWDPTSAFHITGISAVMVSYAEFHKMRARRRAAMDAGLRAYLGMPDDVAIYLDNGAFYFGSQDGHAPMDEYEEFVEKAKPDWKPIPQDYIPFPEHDCAETASVFRENNAGQPPISARRVCSRRPHW